MAKEGGLEFVVFTPPLRGGWWRDGARCERAAKALEELDARCRAVQELCLIAGFEDTTGLGHVGVAFVGSVVLGAIRDEHQRERTRGPFLGELDRAGAVLTINHPFSGGDPKA